jgi:hypothetical protein
MVKFEMELNTPEDTVITVTSANTINLNGQIINIGTHCVTFSGTARLKSVDGGTLVDLAHVNPIIHG